MIKKINTFIRLPIKLKLILLHSIIFIFIIKVLLYVIPFNSVRSFLGEFSTGKKLDFFKPHYTPGEIAWGLKLASKYLLGNKPCLVQALALWTLFKRRGYPADIHIGVRKSGGNKLQAHAWVVSDGKIAIGWLPDMANFVPFTDLRFEKRAKVIDY